MQGKCLVFGSQKDACCRFLTWNCEASQGQPIWILWESQHCIIHRNRLWLATELQMACKPGETCHGLVKYEGLFSVLLFEIRSQISHTEISEEPQLLYPWTRYSAEIASVTSKLSTGNLRYWRLGRRTRFQRNTAKEHLQSKKRFLSEKKNSKYNSSIERCDVFTLDNHLGSLALLYSPFSCSGSCEEIIEPYSGFHILKHSATQGEPANPISREKWWDLTQNNMMWCSLQVCSIIQWHHGWVLPGGAWPWELTLIWEVTLFWNIVT